MGGTDTGGGRLGIPNATRRTILRRGRAAAEASGIAAIAGRLRSGSTAAEGSKSKPAIIGHRGCAAENPENTIAAVESAARLVDAIEVDIRRCATGELVVFHDETLDRLTTANGRVNETPRETLLELAVAEADEPIPTLEEVFEAVPPETKLVLELKESGLAADVLALAADYEHDVLVSSFLPPILEEVGTVDPDVPRAYIVQESLPNRALRPAIPGMPAWFYFPQNVTDLVRKAGKLGCEAIHPRYELCLQTDLVSLAHAADLRVEPWTIRTQREFEAVRECGVDSVISDICSELVG